MMLDPATAFSSYDISESRLLVAVSGGSDSLALLLLAKDHARSPDRITAVTVDHGLRPQAAAEARTVAALCGRLGIAHRTMVWHGDKPKTGLIAAAREARYDLLSRAAAGCGADIVLVGHTMDDQAETVAMRGARGEGPGLAGMADATLLDGRVWILRPLLGVRRQALRSFLAGRGVAWIDDPTNADPAYERVRVRAALADADIEALAATARAQAAARSALSQAAARLLDRRASRPSPGLFRLDPAFAAQEDSAAAVHALRALLGVAGGVSRLPERERAEDLLSRLRTPPWRATLSRAVIEARRDGIWIMRERRNVPALPLSAEPVIWDGRWRLSTGEVGHGIAVAPLGEEAAAAAGIHGGAPEKLARAALSLEPGLFCDGRLRFAAGGAGAAALGVSAVPLAAPFARFLPGFDIALAGALLRLLDAPPLPAAPWKHHIGPEP